MNLFQTPYSEETDKARMIALAQQSPADNLHVIDLPYRLSSWSLDNPDNVVLWSNAEGKLMGWAVMQTPFWTIDYVCHPSAESHLHPVILAWADQRARATLHTPTGHPSWYFTVFEEQQHRIHDLERAGFQCQADVGENSWSQALMRRLSTTPVKVYKPRVDFTVRSLTGEDEVDNYVTLQRSVFESKNMTADWRRRTLEHPAYRRDLDIVVESPEGKLVAFCVGWFDPIQEDAQIEPLGCHKDFRHLALGRVAFSECLHRMQSLGARRIFVLTDSYRNTAFRLYESFDFQVVKNVLVYRKDYRD